MTEEQYWDKDCMLPKYYREAERLRSEKINEQAWLQGMYIYDALARVSPIFNSNAKKGTKAQPYVAKPYPISKKQQEEAEKKKEEAESKKATMYMETYMLNHNKKFKERK